MNKFALDSNATKKTIVAAILGLAVAIYGIKAGVVDPLNARMKRASGKLQEAESQQESARRYLMAIQPRRSRQKSAVEQMSRQKDNVDFVLEPSLGNYEIPAQQLVATWAQKAGLERPPQIQGRAIQQVRWPRSHQTKPLLAIFPVSVSFQAGLPAILRFINVIETENPACRISSLNLSANPASPASHQVTLTLEWPIWVNEGAWQELAAAVDKAAAGFPIEEQP